MIVDTQIEISVNSRLHADKATELYKTVAEVVVDIARTDRNDSARRLLEASKEARVLVRQQDDKIDRIVQHLTVAGKLDGARLTALE